MQVKAEKGIQVMSTIVQRRAPLIFTALAASCLIAACGSASSSSSTTRSSSAAASTSATANGARGNLSAFRNCLKQHGVTLPTRRPGSRPPAGTGGGFFGGGAGGGGFAARNPKLAAAVRACGGFRGGRRLRLSHAAIANYVACVRQHGYHLPNPNFSGKGPVFPAGIRTNPTFHAASRACQNLLIAPRTGTAITARS
jgi:hypothetical protein